MRIGYIRSHIGISYFFFATPLESLRLLRMCSRTLISLPFIFGVFRYSIEFFSCRIFRHMFPPFCNLITSSIPSEAILAAKSFWRADAR